MTTAPMAFVNSITSRGCVIDGPPNTSTFLPSSTGPNSRIVSSITSRKALLLRPIVKYELSRSGTNGSNRGTLI